MGRLVIGIAGGTGAGKTTLAEALAGCMCPGFAVVMHEDRYYRDNSHLPEASREDLNYDHPDAIDLDLLARHVRELVSGRIIKQPVYDFVRHIRKKGTDTVFPANFIIVEGLFTLFNELLRDLIGLRVFLDSEDGTRLSRRLERDVRERGRTKESVIRQWSSTVRPMHELFIQPCRSSADLVLSGCDRVDYNVARIRGSLINGVSSGPWCARPVVLPEEVQCNCLLRLCFPRRDFRQCVMVWIRSMIGAGITPSQTSSNVKAARVSRSESEKAGWCRTACGTGGWTKRAARMRR